MRPARPFLLLLVLLSTPLCAHAQAPAWQVDAAAFSRQMTVVGAVDGADSGDLVAAFVGSEVRGVAQAQLVTTAAGPAWRFFLTVYSRTTGETIAFQHYHAQADAVGALQQTLAFQTNGTAGTVAQPFTWTARPTTGPCTSGNPGWQVDAAAFSRQMTVVGAVDGADSGDLVAAFVGSEVRGVAQAQLVTTAAGPAWRFFLTVYSRTTGETIAFQHYHAQADQTFTLDASLGFYAGTGVGSLAEPFVLPALACAAPGLTISLRVALQGFYDGTGLRAARTDVLPLADPYGLAASVAPGFFQGQGADVADWVWIELRTGSPSSPPMQTVARRAALVRSDGHVVDVDGASGVRFSAPPGTYYVAAGHLSHVPVMSAALLDCAPGACSYDFTTGAGQAYGTAALTDASGSGSGPWALHAGDGDGDGDTDSDDFLVWYAAFGAASAYVGADFDGDGDADSDDFLIWYAAFGAASQLPPSTP